MRGIVRAAVVLAAAAVLASCGGGSDKGSLEDVLRGMVLTAEEVPAGFVQSDASFTSNANVAEGAPDAKQREDLLDEWGRLLGYDVTYDPGEQAADDLTIEGINVSASLYRTESGAGDSFDDAVKTAEETDWAANYAGLNEFQQREIIEFDAGPDADELKRLHLSGLQPPEGGGADRLVTDDLIFFRVGPERGFLRVLANSAETGDRAYLEDTVGRLLVALIADVREALASLDFDLEKY